NVTTLAGTGSAGFSGDGGSPVHAKLNAPTSAAIGPTGKLFFADSNNLVVRQSSNGAISTLAGTPGKFCSPTTDPCGDGGPAKSATFAFPVFVTTDATGNLIVVDYFAHRVRAVNTHNTNVTIAGVTIGPNDIATIAGTGTECGGDFTQCGDGGAATLAR